MSHKSILTIFIAFICLIAAGANFTEAKYTQTSVIPGEIRLASYTVQSQLEYSVRSGRERSVVLAEALDGASELGFYAAGSMLSADVYSVDLSPDELSSMNLAVSYEGACPFYLRLKIDTEFYSTDDNGFKIPVPFDDSFAVLSDGFSLYDNRAQDGYVYAAELIRNDSGGPLSCNFYFDVPDSIAYFYDYELYPNGVEVSVTLEIETVQFNFAPDDWNIAGFHQ